MSGKQGGVGKSKGQKRKRSGGEDTQNGLLNSLYVLGRPTAAATSLFSSSAAPSGITLTSKSSLPSVNRALAPSVARKSGPSTVSSAHMDTSRAMLGASVGASPKRVKNNGDIKSTSSFLPSGAKPVVRKASSSSVGAEDKQYKCDAEGCDKSYSHQFSLNRHMRIHTGKGAHSCETCGRNFGEKRDLDRHRAKHGSLGEKFKCGECGAVFGDKWGLNRHKKRHTMDFACTHPGCDKKFHQKVHCDKHIAAHSPDSLDVMCDVCGKAFESLARVASHKKVHNKKIECEECHRMFRDNADLQRHKKGRQCLKKNVIGDQ
jgi:hypothetical protein